MNPQEIHDQIAREHAGAVVGWEPEGRNPTLRISAASVPAVMRTLREDAALSFDSLTCLSAVDLLDRIWVTYHLFSFAHRHQFVVKVELWRRDPVVPSVAKIWRGARWFEREAYDLVGVQFAGHPDLRRILLPEDWVGHPLRKDFVFPTHYAGIDNQREYE